MTALQSHIEIFMLGRLLAARPHVLSVHGKERANHLYRFNVRMALDPADDIAADDSLLEMPVHVQINGGDAPRSIHGIVLEAAAEAGAYQSRRVFRLRVGPKLALLKLRRYCRVFTDQNVVEIATQLLNEHRIAFRLRLGAAYRKRAYTVQYHESDYAFLRRLLAEVGIFFVFDHPTSVQGPDGMTNVGTTEVVVLCDSEQSYSSLEGHAALQMTAATNAHLVGDSHVFELTGARRPRPTVVLERAYDFQRPDTEIRDTVRWDASGAAAAPHPVYTFGGEGDETPPDLVAAATRLGRERVRAYMGEGSSACRRFMPGRTFDLDGHDVVSLSQKYVLKSVEHAAYSGDAAPPNTPLYQNRFTCVPAATPLRPKLRAKRRVHLTETAIVVGPPGKEIHTDSFGRIQVQFPWDLAGKRDGTTSTWLRVAQGWAGAGWGVQILPRVGMEVVVTFLSGDVDRPLITSAVYNGTHPTPYPLPAESTKSGIRSQSTPGGGGYNEISMDDAKGSEVLYSRAERDRRALVQNDDETHILRDQRFEVDRDRTGSVGNRDVLTVGKERTVTVAGTQTGTSMTSGNISSSTGGATLSLSGNDATLKAAGNISMEAGGNVEIAAQGKVDVTAPTVTVNATGTVVIKAGGVITLDADGAVVVKGSPITHN